MSFRGLPTGNYGTAKIIVATSAANGTHTTLAAAMAAASAGDTIFLRDSVTENVTITPGVNITAWSGSSANTPAIIGTLTMTGAGTSTISGIRLQTNSAAAIAVTGSAASILNIRSCYLDFTNATGITYSSSSSSSALSFFACDGNIGTTGITIFSNSSAGTLTFRSCNITNTGSATTASTMSAGSTTLSNCYFYSPLSLSSSAGCTIINTFIFCTTINSTCVTTANTSQCYIYYSDFSSGTASAISVGTGTTVNIYVNSRISSTNTNAITGAGTIQYGQIFVPSTESYGNNVTTQTRLSGSTYELIQTQTASSSASLTFSTLNKYKNLKLVWNNAIAASAGGQALRLRYNQGAGVVTTGYTGGGVYTSGAAGPTLLSAITTYIILAFSLGNAAPACSGECMIGNVQYDSSTGATYHTTSGVTSGSYGFGGFGGTLGNTAALTALEVTMASGNIAQGTFSLYGIPA